jgi:diguanylate cyclase (GGDEF)-like protein
LENRGLEHRVLHDKMTGLYTYDYLRLRLDDEWKRCHKLSLPVSIVMTDLDRFKKINDSLGHEVGNQMILRAAAVIRESARGYDVVSRYGGDEFVILLWHANALEADAYRIRLRKMYEAMAQKLDEPGLKGSSISIGVASFDPRVDGLKPRNPQELMELADKNLFEDKESRRLPGEEKR